MYLDNSLVLSSAQAVTVTAASTNWYDVTGAGVGNAPALSFGNATVFGADMGLGEGEAIPYVLITVPTAFVSGGGATMQIQIRGAIDNGSNGIGTTTVITETIPLSVAQLASIQTTPLLMPLPPRIPGEALPRFYDVNYVVGTSTFSAGAITAQFVINPTSALTGSQYPNNFTVV